jgi:undecaprenyl-diphosphatase
MAEVGRDLTAMGGIIVLSLVTAAVAGFLLIRGQYGAVVLMVIAVTGGALLSNALKYAYGRPRPSEVPHLSMVYTSSFPSGHSMMSAVVYLTIGALLARFVAQWRLRIYCLIIAVLLTGLVGISRVYMGVHYPTDVLAGWTAGLVWATLCWLVARYLQYRRAVEAGK